MIITNLSRIESIFISLLLGLAALSPLHAASFRQAGTSLKAVKKSEQELRAAAVSSAKPIYPALARAARISGDVVIKVAIDEQGKVTSASVVSGHALLNDAAESAAREWEFTPFKVDEKTVKVTGVLTFKFDPDADPSNYKVYERKLPPPLTEEEKVKKRRAEEAADLFIQRWHETLDMNVLFDEMYVSDPEQRRRNAYLFYGVYQFVTATADGPKFSKEIDEQTLREAFLAFWNWYYLANEYDLAFRKEEEMEAKSPPEATEISQNLRRLKLNPKRMIPAQIKEFIAQYNQFSSIYRKHLPREVFESDLYKKSTGENRSELEKYRRDFSVMDGFPEYKIKKGVEVYKLERGVFEFFFIEENGKLKVLTLGFEL
jgi:TonB family protein